MIRNAITEKSKFKKINNKQKWWEGKEKHEKEKKN